MEAYNVSLQGGIVGFTKVSSAILHYNSLSAVSSEKQQEFANAVNMTNGKLGSYLIGLNGAKASLGGYVLSLGASTIKTVALTVATTALNAALTMGISFLVTGAITAVTAWINASKKITEDAEAAKEKIKSINDELKDNSSTVNEVKQRYAELAQEVENLGKANQNQGNLSTDEYAEFLDISNQLAGVFPTLTSGYDENGNAILNLSGNVDTIVGSLDSLLKKEQELANQQIMKEFPDLYKGYIQDIDKAGKDVNKAQSEFDKINQLYRQIRNGGSSTLAFDLNGVASFEGQDGKSVTIGLEEYKQALKELGIEYKQFSITQKNAFGGDDLKGYRIEANGNIDTAFTSKIESLRKELDYAKQQLDGQKSSIGSYLNTWLQTEFSYNQISDTGLQTAVQDMILGIDFSKLPNDVDKNDWGEVSEYLKRNIIFEINKIQDNPEISNALSQALTNQELMPEDKVNFLQQVKDYFDELLGEDNVISVYLKPQLETAQGVQSSYDSAISNAQNKYGVDLSSFFEKNSINTQEEIDRWNEIADSCETAREAEEKYLNVSYKGKTASTKEVIAGINAMSEGFESLDKIMASMKDKDNPFDYALLDDKKFKDIFSGYTQEYNKFVETVTNSPKNISACQSAFDNLATAFVYGQPIMQQLSDSTADVATQYLKLMGVTNSAEVVAAALAKKHAEAAWCANDLSDATAEEIQGLAAESEQTEAGRQAYQAYIAQKLLDRVFNTNGDIAALAKIMSALGLASDAWKRYYAAKQQQEALAAAGSQSFADGSTYKSITVDREGNVLTKKNGKYYTATGEVFKGVPVNKIVTSYAEQQVNDQSDKYYKDLAEQLEKEAKVDISGYSGGTKTNKGGSNKGSGDKDPTEFDWIERKHKLMEEEMSKLKEQSSDTSLRYTGLDNDTINRALALFDQIHNQITISTDDFSWLAQAASSAGMSLDEFFLHLQDGGGVSRMSALQEILERDKKDLETYTQDAQTYSSMYEEAVSKLTPEYREKIEHGGNDIEELPDKENEAVQKAVKLYDKKKEAEQKVFDIQKDIHDTQSSMYDLELEELEKQNDEIEGRNSLITKQIDYLNTSGRLVNGTAYETLIANLGKQKSIIEQELEVKKRELAAMMESNPDYENSQEYYDLQKSISDSELSLIDLTNQQAEYNDTLRQLPINNAQKLVDMFNNITTAMENWKNEIESAGKSVDADYYQEQIKNGRLTIKQLQEQRAAVEDVMDEYETGSDKWAEMNSKLTDIDSSISSIVVNMNEWNEAMLQIPIDKMEKLVSDLQMVKDALDDVNSEHQTVISAVTGAIDDQREAWEEAQKAETDAIQDKIDAIQDQLDLLDKQNEALDLQIAQEQALKKLEDAKTQKKNRVVRDGEVVYEADQDAIREAADSLQDAEANLKKHELQTEKEKLEDELDTINDKYDDLYDKLDKIANKWDKIQSDREQLGNEQVANRYLGDDWINKVLSGNDDDIYSAFKDLYNQNVDSQEQYESQIKSTEQIQTLVNTYIEAYRSGTLTRDQAMIGIKSVLSSVNHEITAGDNVHNILTYLSTQNSTGATTNDILAATKNQLSTTSKDIMKSLNVYEKNSNMITKYMSSFGELTSNVSDMRSTIHTVSKNLDSIENTISDGIDDIVDAINSINIEVDRESSTSTKHETSSAPNGWQGTHEFDHDNGKEGYEVGWTRKYANGIEEGIIGNAGDKEKYMAIREMATTDLKPSEQPILAHTGEIVLNPDQQAQLLKNIQQSAMVFRPETLNLKPVNMPMIDRAQPNVVYNNYGNFELKDVRDVDGFAKAVGRDFDRCIRQAVSKRW